MTAELNTSCGINVSTETVHRALQGMAFHDQAALVGVIRGRIALLYNVLRHNPGF